jgi:hypothetical protein
MRIDLEHVTKESGLVEGSREIAPISFQDSSGDGKGDLRVSKRIDYLQ